MSATLLLQYLPSLLKGFGYTIVCWVAGTLIGLLLGVVVTACHALGGKPVRYMVRSYIEVFRGTPFLIQLIFFYSAGPSFGLRLGPLSTGILALGLYGGAYFAEVIRGGVAVVPAGQIEAAECLGLTPAVIVWRIMLRQMLVAILPSIVNITIALLKETVVLSIIVVPELMYQIQTMAAETFAYKEALFAMAVFYWVLVEVLSRVEALSESRLTMFLSRTKGQRDRRSVV
jgi:polar amino acid transport system permease protein